MTSSQTHRTSASLLARVAFFFVLLPLVALLAVGATGLATVFLDTACPVALQGTPLCDVPSGGAVPGLLSADARDVAEGIQASVVTVSAASGGLLERTASVGTGLIITGDGLVATANHVIATGGSEPPRVTVTLSSGDRLDARVVGRDPSADVALLQVDAQGLQAASLVSDMTDVSRGDPVVAVGSGSILAQPVLEGSVVSLRSRVVIPEMPGLHRLIETTVALVQGTSGSPLVAASGQVVGLNVAGMYDPDTGERYGGLAVPSDTVLDAVDRLVGGAGVHAGVAQAASF